jgi:hypothetical protein
MQSHLTRLTCSLRDGAACHFLPHEKNDYVPHVLKHRVLLAYSAILVLVKVLLVVGYAALPVASVYSSAVTTTNVIELTNIARAQAGLPALLPNDRLAAAAAAKAADMLANQYFAHTSPAGLAPWNWIRDAGYDYKYAGENLAVHYFTAEGVQDAWMASPTHRQNIVDDRYKDIGIGVASGTYEGFETTMVVQMFGTLKGAASAASAVVIATTPEPTEPAPAVMPEPTEPVSPTPEPEVQPAATEDTAPAVDESSVKVLPADDGYAVALKIDHADSATALIGPSATELEAQEDGTFTGVLAEDVTASGVQYVHVVAENDAGERTVATIASVSPKGTTQDLYVNGNRPAGTAKFLGIFEVRDLKDSVQRFYLYSIIFLAAALVLKIAVKFHIQRHSVIFHALFVIGLAGALMIT